MQDLAKRILRAWNETDNERAFSAAFGEFIPELKKIAELKPLEPKDSLTKAVATADQAAIAKQSINPPAHIQA
jgi:hypothetical protein